MTELETLTGALDLLGANGEHWEQGALRATGPDGEPSFCLAGAIQVAAPDYASYEEARNALKETVGGSIDRWNDRSDRTFDEVRQALTTTLSKL